MAILDLLFILFISTEAKAATQYDLKDLAVLEQEKNFEEFLDHVNDIRPSERQKLWRSMYQSMAMEMIDYKLKTKDFTLVTYKRIEDIGRSGALSNDEFFQLKRSLYAKKFFTDCYNQAALKGNSLTKAEDYKLCDKELSSFWFFSKKDPDVGLELASLIEKHPTFLSTWPFYSTAINDSIAPIYCERPAVQREVIKKLTKESFDPEFDGNYKLLINRFIPEKCFKKVISPLKLSLISYETNGLEKELALSLLSASGSLSKEEEDLYAITYLLDGPVVGEKMNIAWKKVELLNSNFQLRQKLLEKIKNLSIIPDKIFRDPESARNKAIINLFALNFPEFLNFYAESCLNYISHKSVEAQIASSFQCNQFLKIAHNLKKKNEADWISDKISTQYSAIKK